MALSEVSICNVALTMIGAQPITAMDEDAERARACNVLFEQYRDSLLDEFPWNFSTKRSAELTAESTAPAMGYDYAFNFPSDCIRVWEVYDTDAETEYAWVVEEGQVLTDQEDDLYLLYSFRATDPAMFTKTFAECLSLKLAATLAKPKSRGMANDLGLEYKAALLKAKRTDAWEGSKRRENQRTDSTWQKAGR